LFYFIVLCRPRVSEPKAAVGAAIHHVGECSRILMSLSWSAAARRIMSTSAMSMAVLGGAIVVAIAIVVVVVVVVVAVAIVAVAMAIVVAIVAITVVAIAIAIVAIAIVAVVAIAVVAIAVAIAVVVVVVVVVVPHHGGHHVLHLGAHGGLSGLEVGFSTLETVGDFSVIVNWRWLDMWRLLDRWRTLFFENALQH
jgi:hypothetical protein